MIDIQWRKYYLKGTELYGKIQFGENEFLSRRNKFPPIALGETSFFERLSDKKNRYRDILLFYSEDPVGEYISLDTIFVLTPDINTFDVILLSYYNYLTEEYELFYGPAVTKEEAEVIASEYFGFNVNY